jgi:hypothetical protein
VAGRSKPGGRSIVPSIGYYTVSRQQGTGAGQRRCPFRLADSPASPSQYTQLTRHYAISQTPAYHALPSLVFTANPACGSAGQRRQQAVRQICARREILCQAIELKPAVGTAYNSQSESQRHDPTKNENDSIRTSFFRLSDRSLSSLSALLYSTRGPKISCRKRHPYCTAPACHRSQVRPVSISNTPALECAGVPKWGSIV